MTYSLDIILHELTISSYLINKESFNVIYTYFGYGFFLTKTPQVIGSADSNIYYPEIFFWEGYSVIERIKKKFVDMYRIFALKASKAVIFENESMMKRGINLFKIKHAKFIKPSISTDYESTEYKFPFDKKEGEKYGLFLCGWHLNKNIMLIPEIAIELKKLNAKCKIVVTAPKDNSNMYKKFKKKVDKLDVSENIELVGNIDKKYLKSLYQQIDVVFLLSKLESFSNNIIEAWHFKKPLIISDEEWSNSICHDAAVYADRLDSKDIAKKAFNLLNDLKYQNHIIEKGSQILDKYPSVKERTERELNYVSEIKNLF